MEEIHKLSRQHAEATRLANIAIIQGAIMEAVMLDIIAATNRFEIMAQTRWGE